MESRDGVSVLTATVAVNAGASACCKSSSRLPLRCALTPGWTARRVCLDFPHAASLWLSSAEQRAAQAREEQQHPLQPADGGAASVALKRG